MSECSYTAFSAPQPIRGQINWANEHRPTPLSYARFVNGEERRAESIEIDGVEYAPVRECNVVHEYEHHDHVIPEWICDSCSECGASWYEDDLNYCPNCGARVRWGGE